METVTINVEGVNKKGNGVIQGDSWFNLGKGCTQDFSDVKRGDVIEAQVNDGKWVMSFKVLSASKVDAPSVATTRLNGIASSRYTDDDKAQMARSTAVKAIFGGLFASQLKDSDFSEASDTSFAVAKAAAHYILTGEVPVGGK